jgi:hypothetical protein
VKDIANEKQPILDTDDKATITINIQGINPIVVTLSKKWAINNAKRLCKSFPFTQE